MFKLPLFFLIFIFPIVADAQKPLIDSSVYGKWPCIGEAKISNDGKYILYWIDNQPIKSQTVVVCASDGKWEIRIPGADKWSASFCDGGRRVIVKMPGDSLGIFSLGKNKVEYILHVKSFSIGTYGKENWLAYSVESPEGKLVVQDMKSGVSYVEEGVYDFRFYEKGSCIIFLKKSEKDSISWRLACMNILDGRVTTIWKGASRSSFIYAFDQTFKQFAFIEKGVDKGNSPIVNIWRYKIGNATANLLVNNELGGKWKGYLLEDDLHFSKNGSFLFVRRQPKGLEKPTNSSLNVWSYKDKYIQSLQLSGGDDSRSILYFSINLNTGYIRQLNESDEKVIFLSDFNNDDYVIVHKIPPPDEYYIKADRPWIYIESLTDGSRTLVTKWMNFGGFRGEEPALSSKEKFVLWFDGESLNYYCYEIKTRKTVNLSSSVPIALYDTAAVKVGRRNSRFGIAGWLADDRELLIYDQYDIWKVDPTGIRPAVNVTQYLGREQRIVFGIINNDPNSLTGAVKIKESFLLEGFNKLTKENGFWALDEDLKRPPRKLCMEAKAYWVERPSEIGLLEVARTSAPVRADRADVYLVRRMSASESPNLFVTSDFKSFNPVSNIYPERKYNWVHSELVNWMISKDQMSQGILLKPEDFDSTHKYPVIFEYYEKMSDALNEYYTPDYCYDRINIVTYVSNGYLVFLPDIYYTPGKNGEGVVNALVSAAKHLTRFSWVDSTKLGVQGHSFAGWETSFLITHSHMFAAACEASGVTDLVSSYNQLEFRGGGERQEQHETYDQGSGFGVGVTPWTATQTYIENSPVFFVDSIMTPLLIMHTRRDTHVPFEQAIELFMSMRRAGKKVWLLDYEKSNHSLDGSEAIDYTIRMRQFFDYYLKGKPAPIWMTQGISACNKGKELGYEFDMSGAKP